MLRSKDRTVAIKNTHIVGLFSRLSDLLRSGILKDITPLYQEKPEYILYKAPFYKKISAHKLDIFNDTI